MKRLVAALSIVTLTAPLGFAQGLPEALLRHDNFLVFDGTQGRSVTIEVESIPKAGFIYADDLIVEVIDPASERALREIVPLGERASIEYEVALDGTHAVRTSSGWNVVRAGVTGAPWALVAWKDVPIDICGAVDPLYFRVPEGVEQFAIELSASVAGEGAELTVYDPDGAVVFNEADDFVTLRKITIDVPPGADDAIWLMTITDPDVEGLYLDDVQFYLSGRIPPFLSPNPDYLAPFAAGERYMPDLIEREVQFGHRIRLGAAESETITWEMDALPEGKVYALRVTATDIDYPRELMLEINDAEPLAVPMTGNALTDTYVLHIPREMLRVGENTMTLTQDPSGGSLVVVANDLAILIGERIREYRG